MSAPVTDRGAGVNTGYNTTVANSAFTPAANTLLLAIVHVRDNTTDVSAVAGHGTWFQIMQGDGLNGQVEVWGCLVGGSPGSSAVTATHTSSPSSIAVVEVSADYAGASVAASIVQNSGITGGYVTGGADKDFSATLGAFADATNNIAMIFAAVYDSINVFTPQGGITTDHSSGPTSSFNLYIGSLVGEDLTPGVTATSDYANYGFGAVEIALAAGGGGGTLSGRAALLGVGL